MFVFISYTRTSIYVIRILHPPVRFFLRGRRAEKERRKDTRHARLVRARAGTTTTRGPFFFFDLPISSSSSSSAFVRCRGSFSVNHRLVCVVCVVGYIYFFFSGIQHNAHHHHHHRPRRLLLLLLLLSLDGRHE